MGIFNGVATSPPPWTKGPGTCKRTYGPYSGYPWSFISGSGCWESGTWCKGNGKGGKWGWQEAGPVWIDRGLTSGYNIKVQDLPRGPPPVTSEFLRRRLADDLSGHTRRVMRSVTDIHATYTAESGCGPALC